MRFFAPLRSAQNDKSCNVIVNKIFTAIFATKRSVRVMKKGVGANVESFK